VKLLGATAPDAPAYGGIIYDGERDSAKGGTLGQARLQGREAKIGYPGRRTSP
jgi:hypothetical protein